MFQFYFLSVLLNLMTGLILLYGRKQADENMQEAESSGAEKRPAAGSGVLRKIFGNNAFFDDKVFRLVLGILSVCTGVIKLIRAVYGVPFFGDFIPAAAGLIGGAAILINYYAENTSSGLGLPAFLQKLFVDWQKYIGIACITAAVLHFIFPKVLFL